MKLADIAQVPFLFRFNAFPEAHLDSLENVLRLVVVRGSESGGPLHVSSHLIEHLRKCGERFYAGVPCLEAGPVSDLIGRGIALRLTPLRGGGYLRWVS